MIIRCKDDEIGKKVRQGSYNIFSDGGIFENMLMYTPILIDKFNMGGNIFTDGRAIFFDLSDRKKLDETIANISMDLILKHELSHIIFNHIPRGKSLAKNNKELVPYATISEETLINSGIGITSYGITIDKVKEAYKLSDKEAENALKMNMEDFAVLLYKHRAKSPQGLLKKGGSWAEDAEGHVKPEVMDKELQEKLDKEAKQNGYESIDDMIKQNIKESFVKERLKGKGQTGIWAEVENEFYPVKINWRQILFNKIRLKKKEREAELGVKRINRRYNQLKSMVPKMPIQFNKKLEVLDKVYVAIDSSGSIGDEEYIKEASEVVSLVKDANINGEIIFFTDGVDRTIPVNEDTPLSKVMEELKKRTSGGTNLHQVYKYCDDNDANILIVLSGDMEIAFPDYKRRNYETIFITENKSYDKSCEKYGKVYIF